MTFNDEQVPSTALRNLLLVLVCIGALVLSFIVTRQIFGTAGSEGPPRVAPTSTPSGTATTAATATRAPASQAPTVATGSGEMSQAAETCRLGNLRQQAPLSAADVSLAQFDKHIDAMNLLVAGKISLSVATTFWDETRVKAMENAAAFRRADKELKASASGCPAPDPVVANAAPYGEVVAIKSCASAIKARGTALARARTAVTTWEHHVHDMEMLRMGHITPAQATAAWQKDWKTGERQLRAYDKAAAQAGKIPCSLD